MILEARIYLQICEWARVPSWLASIVIVLPCFTPGSWFYDDDYIWDICGEGNTAPEWLKYIMFWIFRSDPSHNCPVYQRWVQWYVVFDVWCFYYIHSIVHKATKILPSGATWGAISLSGSLFVGMAMGLYHYPNTSLETGVETLWMPLEIFCNILQPSLLVWGMAYLPFDMSWWGNSTLGCYIFHFYFKDQMCIFFETTIGVFSFDPTGLLGYFYILFICALFTTFLGPLGHYVLISPQFLKRWLATRKRRAVVQPTPQAVAQEPPADVELFKSY